MRLITKSEQIPDPEKPGSDEFWKAVDNQHLESLLVFKILSVLKSIEPANLTNEQSRSILGELKAYQLLLITKDIVSNERVQQEDPSQDQIE